VICVLLSGTSFAQDLYRTHTLGIGFETFYIDNEEDINPDVSLDGIMYGGYFDYAFHGSNSLMTGLIFLLHMVNLSMTVFFIHQVRSIVRIRRTG